MLLELTIQDFAIIDRLHLDARAGLTVITGETGAGKSIIIDALGALLGGRIGTEYIREGTSAAHIETVVELPEPMPEALQALLVEYGLETDDGTLLLSRDLTRTRSTARANGRATPIGVLQALGQHLATIHGQTDHLALLRAADQLELLDRSAGVQALRKDMALAVASLRRVRAERAALARDDREAARRLDLLRFQIDEIDRAGLRPDEDQELEREQSVLAGAEQLLETSALALTLLSGNGADEPSAEDLLTRLQDALAEVARIDPSRRDLETVGISVLEEVRDLARDVRRYHEQVERDPERLAAVQERLEMIRQLKRKYGATIEEVLTFYEEAGREAESLEYREERQGELADQEKALVEHATELATQLHQERSAAAHRLAGAVESELQELAMRGARFEVAIRQSPDPEGLPCVLGDDASPGPYAFDTTGIDRVEFLVSPNPGESLKPAAKIASGGETSRIMLALQSVLSEADDTPTMVFDEIDVGIGGRNGQVVGEKLWRLAAKHQVFCITHLPQVAIYGDDHLKIAKVVQDGRTRTVVQRLADDGRTEEIAQMLGGQRAGAHATIAAEELLIRAEQWKLATSEGLDVLSMRNRG